MGGRSHGFFHLHRHHALHFRGWNAWIVDVDGDNRITGVGHEFDRQLQQGDDAEDGQTQKDHRDRNRAADKNSSEPHA
jgi:hypothetical protein